MGKTNKDFDKEELLRLIEENPDIVKATGGRGMAKKKPQLFKALLHYKTAEAGLEDFRNRATKVGYNGIKEDMINIATEFGTVKDKMAILLLCYPDRERDGLKPLITKKEFMRLRDEMYRRGYGDEMEVYIRAYSSFRRVEDSITLTKTAYLLLGEKAAQYLVTYLWLERTGRLFDSLWSNQTAFYELVDEYQAKTGTYPKEIESHFYPIQPLLTEYENDLKETSQWGGLLDDDGNTHRMKDTDINSVWEYFKMCCDMARLRLSDFKGAITGVEDWARDTGTEIFIPTRLKIVIDTAPFETAIDAIPDKYCTAYPKRLKEEKEPVERRDLDIAIYPDYEDTKPSREIKEYIKKKITQYFNGKQK